MDKPPKTIYESIGRIANGTIDLEGILDDPKLTPELKIRALELQEKLERLGRLLEVFINSTQN